jgi:two-component system chemotaxis sensor kinase CheA
MLAKIEASGSEGDGEYTSLIEKLARLQASELTPASPAEPKPNAADFEQVKAPVAEEATHTEVPPLGALMVQVGQIVREQLAAALQQQREGDPRHLGEILVDQGAVEPKAVLEALQVQREMGGTIASSSIRVDVGQLDKLMNLVGELVLTRNQILQFSATQQDPVFLGTTQRLNLVTTELQEGVMKTRMQPIDNIWNKFPRVVRDLALACGKQVRVEMEGKETELDKTLIEAIKDPLTHLIRNSVDHGIESPEKREAAGKPPEGRLLLRAYHEGGQVNIEVSDDGAGVDVPRVKHKAVERGLITPQKATQMSEREALDLLFLPGFSTAQKVTKVSGRGVGMDVVKTNIEKIGGSVDIQSSLGKGTTIKIKIPLTLAIIPALMVTTGGDRYAIPQVSLLELVHLEGEQAKKGIEMIHGAPVYRLRGNLLPLVNLNHELCVEEGVKGSDREPLNGSNSFVGEGTVTQTLDFVSALERQMAEHAAVNIVVLQADGRHFGLVVDGINDTEEIVVKPLGKQIKGISTFAGATIMGDGQVALILDVLGLAQRANVVSEVRDRGVGEKAAEAESRHDDGESLLLLRGPDDGRMAMPLSLVARLEEFARTAMERSEGQYVVQYRGQILPLIHLSSALTERRQQPRNAGASEPGAEDEKIQVVVYTDQGRSVGLVVDRILDIAHEVVKIQQRSGRQGTLGSMVVQGRVTELLDVKGIIQTAVPDFFNQAVEA